MKPSPVVIVCDVNETLSDMSPMADRFADVGAPKHLASLWFATLLRDGFALNVAAGQRPFAELAVDALRMVLHGVELDRDLDAAIGHIMDGFNRLKLHPDVAGGVRALRADGCRLVTLSNGSTQVAEQLFAAAGIRDAFEALLSVEHAGAWKPARSAYEHAAGSCGTALEKMMLVAVHPWDIDGANRAGMSTAWINRNANPYPAIFSAPTLTVTSLLELHEQLIRAKA